MTNSRLLMVKEFPDGEGTAAWVEAELQAKGMVEMVCAPPVTDTMKQEMAMAPEVLIPLNSQSHSQLAISELMKLYNAGEKNCVVKIPNNFRHDDLEKLWHSLDETLPELMTEKVDESGRLRRLKVFFMKED